MKRLSIMLAIMLCGMLAALAAKTAPTTKPAAAAKPAPATCTNALCTSTAKPVATSTPAAKTLPVPLVGLYYFPKNSPGFDGLSDAQIADKLAGMGINAVWGYEREAAFIDAMHARGIKVFYTQPMGYGWHHDTRPVLENGELLDTYAPGHWYQGACPNNPERIQEELNAIRDVVSTTKVDGVWLDSIRFPIYWEAPEPKLVQGCFCPRCLTLFQNDTHIAIPANLTDAKAKADWILANHEADWTAWKMMRITNKVKRVNQVVKAANPNAVLGIFSVPWRRSDYNNAIEKIVSQDFPNLANHIDVISPMVYHRMCGHNDNVQWINDIVKYMQVETGGRIPVVPIIQTINENSSWSTYTLEPAEVGKATASALKAPSNGVIVLTGFDLFANKHENAFEAEVKKGLRK